MAMPFRPFSSVPEEILLNILGNASAADHLNIKLVCAKFCRCASAIDTTTLSLTEAAKCHAAIEAGFSRNRALRCCCCTRCGLVKDTDQFSDPQAKKTTKSRTCIACGIRRLKYSAKCLPSVGGEERIPCYECLQPMSTYDGWRLKSAEAKAPAAFRWREDLLRALFGVKTLSQIPYDAATESGDSADPCRSGLRLVLAESWSVS